MLFFNKEPQEEKSKRYGFDYEFGIRGEKGHEFRTDCTTLEEAESSRDKVLTNFRDAIKNESFADVDDGLSVRGPDLTWFWVGEVWEK